MTIVGKILVFVNLVFSLIVGGLVMIVYMTRTNWEDGFNKKSAQLNAVVADRDQTKIELEKAKTEYDAGSQKLTNDVAALRKERDDAQRRLATAEQNLAAIQQKGRAGDADVKVYQETSDGRRKQVAELEMAVDTLRDEKRTIIAEKNEERKARIQADVESRTYKSRNLELEGKVRDMARELVRATNGPAGIGVTRPKKGEENFPADNVEGQIVTVDADNLVKLSIGSDAGLTPGHTLKVFRLHPIAEQSRYLGVIEILAVRPNEAVGRPLRPMTMAMLPGDHVASNLFGGK